MLSSGAQKCSFEKSPRRAWRLPTSIFFDADAHFVCLPKESQPQPPTGVAHTPASQLSGPFSCTCPLLASVWACSTTPGQGAIAGSARLPLNSARAHMAAVAFNERGSRDLRYGEVRHCVLSFGALEIDIFFCRLNCFERKKKNKRPLLLQNPIPLSPCEA